MSTKRDFYEILGVSKDADATAVKAAYKKLAVKYHPDKNPGNKDAEDKFKEAAEAYDVLSNQEKRARYDRFGHEGLQGMGAAGGAGFSNFEDIFSAFGDIFGGGDAFGFGGAGGGRRRRGGAPAGSDLQIQLPLTLEEIATGVTKKIKLRRYNSCDVCSGQGGTGQRTCPTCGGAGQVRQIQTSFFGQMVNITACPDCSGMGSKVASPCSTCGGEGRKKGEVTLSVDIPAGVAEGNYLNLRGEGNAGPKGGPQGDVVVIIQEKPHEIFHREGQDIHSQIEVPYTAVALGGEVHAKTLDGTVALKIPPGTQSEKRMRLKGKGLPSVNGREKGDQYVKIHVHTPENLSIREKELLKELAKEEAEQRPRNFFENMKAIFT